MPTIQECIELQKKSEDDGLYFDWDETPFLRCDRDCGALREPVTLEETQAALAHWRDHSVHFGCSHGR